MQSQAEQVVSQGAKDSIGVEQALDPGPAHLFLKLVEAEVGGREKDRRWASRDVVAQESEDIDQDGQTKGDDKSAGAAIWLGLTCLGCE